MNTTQKNVKVQRDRNHQKCSFSETESKYDLLFRLQSIKFLDDNVSIRTLYSKTVHTKFSKPVLLSI